jgi:hypothetical protein
MAFTEWRSVGSSGVISDTPASAFQYRYYIDHEFGPFDLAPRLQGEWKVQIVTADGVVLFEQTVTLVYYIVSLVMGGILMLFTWWVDLQNQHIDTTVPDPVQTLGHESAYADPAGGGDIIAGNGHLMFEWYSPVYQVPLPAGCKFKIKFHNVGASALRSSLAVISTRVQTAGGLTGARLMSDGMTRLVRPRPGGGLSWTGACDLRALGASGGAALWPYSETAAPASAQVESIVSSTATAGVPFLLHEVKPVVVLQEGSDIAGVVSTDDGTTWGTVMQLVSGLTMSGACMGPDGGTIYVLGMMGGSPAVAVCGIERDPVTAAQILRAVETFTAEGLPSLPSGLQFLTMQNGVATLVFDKSGSIEAYTSTDGMRSWL